METKIVNTFKPYSWQIPPWNDTSPVMLLDGGAGGGKSKLIAEKIHAYMKKYKNATGLILRKNREAMTNSTILFLEREVMKGDDFVVHKEGKHRFEYVNGSILAYGGMKDDKQREAIRSIGQKGAVDVSWMEEANQFSEEDYNEVLARMRGNAAPWRQVILSTNPDKPNHWINKRLIIGKESVRFVSYAHDNPLNDDQYIKTLNTLTGAQKERLLYGRWVKAEGIIYKDFNYNKQVFDKEVFMDYKDYKKIVFGADANFPKPRACVLIGFRAAGIDILDEFYRENCQVEGLRTWLEEQSDKLGSRIAGNHDPSDPSAIDILNQSPKILCEKGNNSVSFGISEVARYFSSDTIRINKSCVNFIEELQSYSWKRGSDEVPEKVHDHLMDSIRYVLASIKPEKTFSRGRAIF